MRAAAQDARTQAEKSLAAACAAAKAAEQAQALAEEEEKKSAALLAERLAGAGFADEAAFRAVLTGAFATADGRKKVAERIRAYEDAQTAFSEAEKKSRRRSGGAFCTGSCQA